MFEFADNNKNIVLDNHLSEYVKMTADPNFIIYNQLLKQLHLPAEKWEYDKEEQGKVLIALEEEVEELDAIIFKDLDYSKLASPSRLYQYNLLQLLLGRGLNYRGVGMIRERKTRFLFLTTEFDLEEMENSKFEENDLSRFIIRRAKKRELLTAHESFFVLLNEKFRTKLLNALILYQSETGNAISKTEYLDKILNMDRLNELKQFSAKQINRL